MKSVIVIAIIALSANFAHTDFFYKLVGCECDKKANAFSSPIQVL
jgi:hypothetical protein